MSQRAPGFGALSADNVVVRFFRSLWDLSFRELIAPKLISILYVLSGIGIVIYRFLVPIYQARDDPFKDAGDVLLAILWSAVLTVLGLILNRAFWELWTVVLKISESMSGGAATLRRVEILLSADGSLQRPKKRHSLALIAVPTRATEIRSAHHAAGP